MHELDRLVKMANQIADNFEVHDDVVERTADHLRRFWAPSMRQKLAEHAANGGDLDLMHQKRLEKRGITFVRVPNDHDDVERFRSDVVAAFRQMFEGAL